eukprot:TRINITY_DN3006_c0_g1_i10.p7 TRINITY_DN3006_c0_g1~~TRINITY_DN3006_c0_g1_i10.p7  ORF type:complete len:101 (+),score=5.66 TRINITY_DN3006_c0_g1_i10:1294-1596(+)
MGFKMYKFFSNSDSQFLHTILIFLKIFFAKECVSPSVFQEGINLISQRTYIDIKQNLCVMIGSTYEWVEEQVERVRTFDISEVQPPPYLQKRFKKLQGLQ